MPNRFGWLKKLALHNSGTKLLALLLAALTFFAIRGEISFERTYEILVDVKTIPTVRILEQYPLMVNVTFRGSEEDLARLVPNQIKVVVASRQEAGLARSETIPIKFKDVIGGAGVNVVKIEPASVDLTFTRKEITGPLPGARSPDPDVTLPDNEKY